MNAKIFTMIGGILALATVCGFAQGPNSGVANSAFPMPYSVSNAPAVTLPEAYGLALSHLGQGTNRFYCVSATCLEMTERGWPGWSFSFANTNGQRLQLEVAFDKKIGSKAMRKGDGFEIVIDPGSGKYAVISTNGLISFKDAAGAVVKSADVSKYLQSGHMLSVSLYGNRLVIDRTPAPGDLGRTVIGVKTDTYQTFLSIN